jgi:hypothetical protein
LSKERQTERYSIGSTAEFVFDGAYYQTVVSNTSMGGVLLELNTTVPLGIFVGFVMDIRLFDIFSDLNYVYPAKVMRKGEKEFAVEFLQPLTSSQEKFLKRWLGWQP